MNYSSFAIIFVVLLASECVLGHHGKLVVSKKVKFIQPKTSVAVVPIASTLGHGKLISAGKIAAKAGSLAVGTIVGAAMGKAKKKVVAKKTKLVKSKGIVTVEAIPSPSLVISPITKFKVSEVIPQHHVEVAAFSGGKKLTKLSLGKKFLTGFGIGKTLSKVKSKIFH